MNEDQLFEKLGCGSDMENDASEDSEEGEYFSC